MGCMPKKTPDSQPDVSSPSIFENRYAEVSDWGQRGVETMGSMREIQAGLRVKRAPPPALRYYATEKMWDDAVAWRDAPVEERGEAPWLAQLLGWK